MRHRKDSSRSRRAHRGPERYGLEGFAVAGRGRRPRRQRQDQRRRQRLLGRRRQLVHDYRHQRKESPPRTLDGYRPGHLRHLRQRPAHRRRSAAPGLHASQEDAPLVHLRRHRRPRPQGRRHQHARGTGVARMVGRPHSHAGRQRRHARPQMRIPRRARADVHRRQHQALPHRPLHVARSHSRPRRPHRHLRGRALRCAAPRALRRLSRLRTPRGQHGVHGRDSAVSRRRDLSAPRPHAPSRASLRVERRQRRCRRSLRQGQHRARVQGRHRDGAARGRDARSGFRPECRSRAIVRLQSRSRHHANMPARRAAQRRQRSQKPRHGRPRGQRTPPEPAHQQRALPRRLYLRRNGRLRALHAHAHIPRLPLRQHHSNGRRQHTQHHQHTRNVHSQGPRDGHHHHRPRRRKPAHLKHHLGHAQQLPLGAYRLPAAQRAPRLDGRHAGVRRDGHLLRQHRRLLPQMDARHARHAEPHRQLPRRSAMGLLRRRRLHAPGLGRLRHHRALDRVEAVWRRQHHQRELGSHVPIHQPRQRHQIRPHSAQQRERQLPVGRLAQLRATRELQRARLQQRPQARDHRLLELPQRQLLGHRRRHDGRHGSSHRARRHALHQHGSPGTHLHAREIPHPRRPLPHRDPQHHADPRTLRPAQRSRGRPGQG